jgi:amino acid transporter
MRFRDLVVYGLLFIGPAAAVSVFGPIDARSGGAVALVYLAATVAMGFTAASYAQMARVVPRAGSVFSYASAGIGPKAGFLAGWVIMLDYLLVPGLCYLVTGLALHSFVPSVPAWIFTAGAVILTTAFNLAGAKFAARAGTWVVLAEIAILLIIFVGAIYALGTHGAARPALSPLIGMHGLSATAVLGAVSVAVLSFLGFDGIASFAEENTGEPRQIGRATIACLAIVGLLFVAQTYLGALISPSSPDKLTADPALQGSAYYDAVRFTISPWVATTLAIVKAVGAAFAAMVGQAASSRLMYGMARDGRLPRSLGAVSERTHTPTRATWVAAVLTLVISVVAARRADGLDIIASSINVGALTAFVLLHVSVFAYFVARGRSWRFVPHVLVPAVGLVINAIILGLASTQAQILGAAWLVVGAIVLAFQTRRKHGENTAPATTDSDALTAASSLHTGSLDGPANR